MGIFEDLCDLHLLNWYSCCGQESKFFPNFGLPTCFSPTHAKNWNLTTHEAIQRVLQIYASLTNFSAFGYPNADRQYQSLQFYSPLPQKLTPDLHQLTGFLVLKIPIKSCSKPFEPTVQVMHSKMKADDCWYFWGNSKTTCLRFAAKPSNNSFFHSQLYSYS